MRRLRINPTRSTLFILLALAAVALLGCAQAEADTKPLPTKAPEPALVATATPILAPTPTPTPFPAAASDPIPAAAQTPSHLDPKLLLPRINSAMAGVGSFQAQGSWIVEESGRLEGAAVVTHFEAEVDLQGDRRFVLTRGTKDSSSASRRPFEMRQVDGITYAEEPLDGRWSIEEGEEVSFLQQATFKAALSGRLALEEMSLEQVVSADWRQVYRITGSVPNDPEVDRVVILVDPEEMLILELQLKGHVSSSERGDSQPQPNLLDVRLSKFNEPIEIPTPQLIPAQGPMPEPGRETEARPGPKPELGPEIEVLQLFLQNSKDVTSFRANMNIVMEADGEVVTVRADMEQGKDGRARLSMDLDMDLDLNMDVPIRMEMIIDAQDLYIKTNGEGWQRFSGEHMGVMGSEVIPSSTELFGNPFAMDDALWQSFTVKSLGDEEVNGVVAEHLEIEVDLKDLWDQLIHELNAQLGGTLSLSPEETDEAWKVISQGLEIKEFDAWIDHEGYLRKALLALAFGLPESSDSNVFEFEMEINLFDYGEDIIIELPAEYEDVSSLFGNQIYYQ